MKIRTIPKVFFLFTLLAGNAKIYSQSNLSGNVYNDANGLTDGLVNSSATSPTIPSGLNAVLYDSTDGKVTAVIPIDINGFYDFGSVLSDHNYSIVLTDSTPAINDTVFPSSSLPADWANVGDNNAAGSPDPSPDGIINLGVVNTNLSDLNFGIDNIPATLDVDSALSEAPLAATQIPLDGIGNNFPPLLGNDLEEGPINNDSTTVIIKSLPIEPGVVLYYNGIPVTLGQEIVDFISSLLTLEISDPTVTTSTTFIYSITDKAGVESNISTYAIDWSVALPLNLIYFGAKFNNCDVIIDWTTVDENNVKSFELQYSNNSKDFNTIGNIAANNTPGVNKYNFTDNNFISNKGYYRLKIVDFDGKFEYSNVLAVTANCKQENKIFIYPNPAQNNIHISGIKVGNVISIYSITGQKINSLECKSIDNFTINVNSLADGMYNIRINDGLNIIHSGKILIQH